MDSWLQQSAEFVLIAIQNHPQLELQLIISASALLDRYGSAVNFIEKDGFCISAKVFNVLEGENLTAAAKTTGIGILELSTVFDNLKPDIVVTVADRFETMATAIAASYMNIPLAHIQGGEVTGNIDEKVRHAITGCPSIDIASEISKIEGLNFDPYQKYGGVGAKPDLSDGYLVVMQHPVTTEYQNSRKHIEETLEAVKKLNLPTLWFWPNVDAGADGTSTGIRAFREHHQLNNVHFFKNMEGGDFLILLNKM